jgi:hypothetical protein
MLQRTVSGAAIALALTMTSPTLTAAQEVVAEPGNCAFFYPYANCQNKGPGNPDVDPYFRRSLAVAPPAWSAGAIVDVAPKRMRVRHVRRLE